MSDIVVTVPKTFKYYGAPGLKGLAAWIVEGDAAGTEWSGMFWGFSVAGARPKISTGERVYIVCEDRLRGYSPLIDLVQLGHRYWELVRAGGAVAVTIPQEIIGFRGWRYRWWEYSEELPFPDWYKSATKQPAPRIKKKRGDEQLNLSI